MVIVGDNSRYFKDIVDNTVIAREEMINFIDSGSINCINIISANVTSTVPKNFDGKKIRYKMDCYIFYTFLLVTMLLLTISTIWCHYIKHS